MMYIHRNNEIDKRINVSKIATNISTMGDNSTAAGCNSRLITVLVQHARDIVSGSDEKRQNIFGWISLFWSEGLRGHRAHRNADDHDWLIRRPVSAV